MRFESKSTTALMVCAFFVAPAAAQSMTNWISNSSAIWNDDDHWDNGTPEGQNAKHLTKLNHIQVAGNRSALSFEGKSGSVDRFLLVESENTLTFGTGGLFKTTGIGVPAANFVVKLENGTSGDKTMIDALGVIDGIDFGPAAGERGTDITILFRDDLKNSSIKLSDDVKLDDLGYSCDVVSTSISLGDSARIGD